MQNNQFQYGSLVANSRISFYKKERSFKAKINLIGYMHGINRISLLVFIICLIILAFKLLRK
ncbi:MAG: hypothetical protein JWM28_1514 [Chitinophagaceae bacterium]|nr:hypothetical protein [Chitinophagaceae bacterium]